MVKVLPHVAEHNFSHNRVPNSTFDWRNVDQHMMSNHDPVELQSYFYTLSCFYRLRPF